jgi:predicted phosphodiesterase
MTDPDMGSDPTKVMVAGDWHGNVTWADSCLWYANKKGADVVLQVGDFGFWVDGDHTDFYLSTVDAQAAEWGIRVYWLDGNHEDHTRRAEFNSPDRPNTVYLPRGFRWDWWGKRFMAVGGAYSVDRQWRKEGVSWWPEETLTDDEVAYASRYDGTRVDYVFAHDCPTGVNIPGIGADTKGGVRGNWPPEALYQAGIHRNKMRTIWKATSPSLWIHGHYHIAYESWTPETRFVGLGADQDLMTRSVCFLTGCPDGSIEFEPPSV